MCNDVFSSQYRINVINDLAEDMLVSRTETFGKFRKIEIISCLGKQEKRVPLKTFSIKRGQSMTLEVDGSPYPYGSKEFFDSIKLKAKNGGEVLCEFQPSEGFTYVYPILSSVDACPYRLMPDLCGPNFTLTAGEKSNNSMDTINFSRRPAHQYSKN